EIGNLVDVSNRAKTPTELEFDVGCLADSLDGVDIGSYTVTRAVEVDDMNTFGLVVGPSSAGIGRIFLELCFLVVSTLDQTDRLSAANIYGRIHDHDGSPVWPATYVAVEGYGRMPLSRSALSETSAMESSRAMLSAISVRWYRFSPDET